MFTSSSESRCSINCPTDCPIEKFKQLLKNPDLATISQITDQAQSIGMFPEPELGSGTFKCIRGDGRITISNEGLIG
jgi:hypothetical protein